MSQSYFVMASYAVSAVVICGLALWIFIRARHARLKVERLEQAK